MRAAIYTRISDDDTGEALGVGRQEEDCRALAERLGWDVVAVYSDNDVSASRYARKVRSGWRAMLTAITEGTVNAVVCWDQDRLVRRPLELEELFAICDRAGVRHLATVSGEVDLSTTDGMFTARILGAVAAKESDNLSRRLRRKHAEIAAMGRWSGGPIPYGYRRGGPAGIELDPAEAAEIRWAVDAVLGGASLGEVHRRWSETIPPRRAEVWSITAIRKVLTADRIAGYRSLDGTVAEVSKVYRAVINLRYLDNHPEWRFHRLVACGTPLIPAEPRTRRSLRHLLRTDREPESLPLRQIRRTGSPAAAP